MVGGLSLLFANFVLVTDPDKLVSRIRELWFDSVLKWTPRDPGPDSPIVIDIGRNALAKFGTWPWPRERLAQLINRIADGKPKVMAVDILLPPREPPADDELLARAISRIPTVLGAFLDPEPGIFSRARYACDERCCSSCSSSVNQEPRTWHSFLAVTRR